MSTTLFVTLLTFYSVVTGFITEGVKKLFNEKEINYSANILAFVVSCVVGVGGTGIYYVLSSIPFNETNIICMFLMGISTSFGSMVGYDKIIQTINQFEK